eukprot:scaffold124336_cov63-Phaeocystis_antarctica.AAC.4
MLQHRQPRGSRGSRSLGAEPTAPAAGYPPWAQLRAAESPQQQYWAPGQAPKRRLSAACCSFQPQDSRAGASSTYGPRLLGRSGRCSWQKRVYAFEYAFFAGAAGFLVGCAGRLYGAELLGRGSSSQTFIRGGRTAQTGAAGTGYAIGGAGDASVNCSAACWECATGA